MTDGSLILRGASSSIVRQLRSLLIFISPSHRCTTSITSTWPSVRSSSTSSSKISKKVRLPQDNDEDPPIKNAINKLINYRRIYWFSHIVQTILTRVPTQNLQRPHEFSLIESNHQQNQTAHSTVSGQINRQSNENPFQMLIMKNETKSVPLHNKTHDF